MNIPLSPEYRPTELKLTDGGYLTITQQSTEIDGDISTHQIYLSPEQARWVFAFVQSHLKYQESLWRKTWEEGAEE